MHAALANALPQPVLGRFPLWVLVAVATVQTLFGILAAQFGWALAFAPWAIGAVAVALIWPRAGVYMLVTLTYIRVSLPGLNGIYPADAMTFLVIAGTMMGRLIGGKDPWVSTRLNKTLLIILVLFGLSLLMAHNMSAGVTNWFRHLQLFWLMLSIIGCIDYDDIGHLVNLVLVLTAIVSAWNVAAYVLAEGGRRVFGPAGPFFPTFLAATICQSAVGFLFGKRRLHRAGWAGLWLLYMAALVAAQTREVMLQVVVATIFLFYLVWRWSSKYSQGALKRRTIILVVALSAIAILLLSNSVPLLQSPSQRVIQAVEGRAMTVNYRLFLWKTGLNAFADSPILGIGLDQVRSWNEILPFWHLDPMAISTKGLGAHNDFITYIAETGLIGMAGLLTFFWLLVRMGGRLFFSATTRESARAILMLWLPVCAVIMRFFFGTHMFYSLSGILTALYVAFLIKYCESRTPHSPALQ